MAVVSSLAKDAPALASLAELALMATAMTTAMVTAMAVKRSEKRLRMASGATALGTYARVQPAGKTIAAYSATAL